MTRSGAERARVEGALHRPMTDTEEVGLLGAGAVTDSRPAGAGDAVYLSTEADGLGDQQESCTARGRPVRPTRR